MIDDVLPWSNILREGGWLGDTEDEPLLTCIDQQEECTHAKIIALPPESQHPAEMAYQCEDCGKKVAVPYQTIREQGASCIPNIIKLTFGPGEKRLGNL